MRKVMVVMIAMSLFFASCGNKSMTPSEVAVKSQECLYKGDVDGYMAYVAGTDEEIEKAKSMASMASMAIKEEGGEIKSVKATKETIAEDGKTAVVEIEAVAVDKEGKEEKQNSEIKLALVDGKWTLKIETLEM